MGGKRRLGERLIPLLPSHEYYDEVFAGGGALYFLRPQPASVEMLNDINGDLVTLYRVVQNHLEEFVRQFKWALSSRQIFEWQKMTRTETLTDIQRVAEFSTCNIMPSVARFRGRVSVQQQLLLQSICCGLKKASLQTGSVCPAPKSKTSPGLSAQSATTARLPSTTWTRLTGRPQDTGWTFCLKSTSAWLTLCGAAKAR